eukprot:TRINITY_DN31232_c0_g1_i1.p1 TRINITY_DN31232_c0_g1~~TRINITY_DN31232_c0_g1_i1.p1  ORF type:complete len:352 (+),score=101.29 TRINITY_DN31232_c0_g1_i1:74-1057(+)
MGTNQSSPMELTAFQATQQNTKTQRYRDAGNTMVQNGLGKVVLDLELERRQYEARRSAQMRKAAIGYERVSWGRVLARYYLRWLKKVIRTGRRKLLASTRRKYTICHNLEQQNYRTALLKYFKKLFYWKVVKLRLPTTADLLNDLESVIKENTTLTLEAEALRFELSDEREGMMKLERDNEAGKELLRREEAKREAGERMWENTIAVHKKEIESCREVVQQQQEQQRKTHETSNTITPQSSLIVTSPRPHTELTFQAPAVYVPKPIELTGVYKQTPKYLPHPCSRKPGITAEEMTQKMKANQHQRASVMLNAHKNKIDRFYNRISVS